MAWRIHGNVGRHHPVHFFSFAHATSAVRTTKSNDLSDANKKYKRHTHTHTHTHTHPSQPLRIAEWRRALRTWRPRIPFPFFFISKAKKTKKKQTQTFDPIDSFQPKKNEVNLGVTICRFAGKSYSCPQSFPPKMPWTKKNEIWIYKQKGTLDEKTRNETAKQKMMRFFWCFYSNHFIFSLWSALTPSLPFDGTFHLNRSLDKFVPVLYSASSAFS